MNLAPAQRLKDVNRSVFRYLIRKCILVDHDGVVNTEVNMPAQRTLVIEYIVGESGGNLIDGIQDFGNGASRNRNRPILQLGEKPVEVSSHFNAGHIRYPNLTEYTGGK